MISNIPNVFTMRNAMNHFLWESCADFHNAMPFHTMVQITSTTSRVAIWGLKSFGINVSIWGIIANFDRNAI